jgi:hypothetical protein
MLKLNYRDNIYLDWLVEIFIFPFWWYSVGLLRAIHYVWGFLLRREQQIGFLIWFENIFVPMYGQTDFISRLISFIIRLFQVIVRGLVLILFIVIALAMLVIWLILPPLAIYQIYFNFNVKVI